MHAGCQPRSAVLELLECGIQRIAHLAVRPDALHPKRGVAAHGLVLELVYSHFVGNRATHAKDVAGLRRGIGNERVIGLFQHTDYVHFRGVFHIGIPQLHVDELDSRHGLELLLDATASLDGVFQQHPHVFAIHFAVGEDEFGEAAEGLAHADLVATVEVAVEAEVPVDVVREVASAHGVEEFAQAVGDEAVALADEVRAHLGNLPAGQVAVDAIEERAVIVKLGRERVEQVRGLEYVGHGVVDIALEHHGSLGVERLGAASECAVGHVALHDLDGVLVAEVHASDLVEGDAVPVPHQADALSCTRRVVGEELCRGGLPAGEQVGVGRDLGVDVRLARSARPQFAQVVVELHKRHHAREEVHALARREGGRLITG